jgi:hypothetical protein
VIRELENLTIKSDIRKRYKFMKILGEGSFGTVREANDIENPSLSFAIKTVPK